MKKNTTNQMIFNRKLSSIVKIIAILLMFCHHFFNISWIDDENMFISIFAIGNVTIEEVISDSGAICIALFAFVSGYGLFFSMKKDGSWRRCLQRVIYLYLDFWVVLLLVFVPAYFHFKSYLGGKQWIENILGLESVLNQFDWYVPFYVIAVVFVFVYAKYIEPCNEVCKITWGGIIVSWIITIFISQTLLIKYVTYIIVMLSGYLCAKYGILDRIYLFIKRIIQNKTKERFLGIFIMVFIICWRYFISTMTRWSITNQFDWLLAILFVSGVICTFNDLPEKVEKYCKFGGRLTTNMWYLHAIFFGVYINLQWIAYWPKISILIILWVYALLIPFSWGLMKVQAWVKRVVRVK